VDPARILELGANGAVTLAAAWLGVRLELRHIWRRLDELRHELHTERDRINRLHEAGMRHEPIA